jgi:NitT/TauT family transport system ATP-binding protein
MKNKDDVLVDIQHIKKTFPHLDRSEGVVLQRLSFKIYKHEIVAILGRSGCGKSTLLRTLSGLTRPTSGAVYFRGQEVLNPLPGMGMVFQNFALFPWLTVLQNVELGLIAKGISREKRRERALKSIDIVGLDGFESAYPRELSGGMSQRVGLSRALVLEPDIIFMDEPFSALDILTAENLRKDLLNLWNSGKTNIKSIVFVTHNIDEAVYLADRVLILGGEPARIQHDFRIDLPHPRSDQDKGFAKMVNHIYQRISDIQMEEQGEGAEAMVALHHRLPKADISELIGLLETIASSDYAEQVELTELAEDFHLEGDDLFPVLEAIDIMGFANLKDAKVSLTIVGKKFAAADVLSRKQIFATQILNHVSLAKKIREELDKHYEHCLSEDIFLDILRQELNEDAAAEVLKTVIDWGRYAEIFAYHANQKVLSLEDPE